MTFQIIINGLFIFKHRLARIHNFQGKKGSGKQNKCYQTNYPQTAE